MNDPLVVKPSSQIIMQLMLMGNLKLTLWLLKLGVKMDKIVRAQYYTGAQSQEFLGMRHSICVGRNLPFLVGLVITYLNIWVRHLSYH